MDSGPVRTQGGRKAPSMLPVRRRFFRRFPPGDVAPETPAEPRRPAAGALPVVVARAWIGTVDPNLVERLTARTVQAELRSCRNLDFERVLQLTDPDRRTWLDDVPNAIRARYG